MKTNILICVAMIGLFIAINEYAAAVVFFIVAAGMVVGINFKSK